MGTVAILAQAISLTVFTVLATIGLFVMSTGTLQETVPFETRSAEARRILSKYPDRIPIVCENAAGSTLPPITKKKFLVPGMMLCGEFKYLLHKHINQCTNASLKSDNTLYLFVNTFSLKTGALMSEVYERFKADDNFLYIT